MTATSQALRWREVFEGAETEVDRVVVDKKIANREGHLRDLRKLIKKVHALDQKVDAKYEAWQKAQQKGRKEKLERELKKMSAQLQELFPKFYYKQKVIEEMIVVAGNVHEKFQASLRRIQELTNAGLNLEGVRQVLALEEENERLRQALAEARQEAREAVERTHRQYRRDLVPLRQLPAPFGRGPHAQSRQ